MGALVRGQAHSRVLKKDLLGIIELRARAGSSRIHRDTRAAHPLLRGLARYLLQREQHAMWHMMQAQALGASFPQGIIGAIPRLISFDGERLEREWIPGLPLQDARPHHRQYFVAALRLLRRLHSCGLTHNDLAKEPNWLVTPDGQPALVDFQLARLTRGRGPLFRALAHTDLRHLYKHKRTYCPEALTARQRRLLATPSLLSRLWHKLVKPGYLFVTRRLLGWADREGRYERD